jgi:D-alanyl-D-alanine carboxypeptidase
VFVLPLLALLLAPAATLEQTVDDALAAPIQDRRFSGVVLVQKDGRTLLRKAYGMADRALGTPNTPDTPFMIMSVSKQFTAALILRLAAQGRLDVHDQVSDYLADWPPEWDAVTIHDLLTHSAGIDIDMTYFWLVRHHPEYWADPSTAPPPYVPRPLVTKPGTTYLYSNVGFTLLTRIASAATGRPFDDLMRDEVFCPLDMTHTLAERGTPVPGRARGYRRTADGFEVSEQTTVDIVGAGDVVSTVDDLAKWDEALLDDRFLPAAQRTAMFTPHVRDQKGWVGYGWFLRTRDHGTLRLHAGSGAGFRAWNYVLPESRINVILLSNVLDDQADWALALLARIERSLR